MHRSYNNNDEPAHRSLRTRCFHSNPADYNYFYYEEYKKLYAASFMLSTQVPSSPLQMKELLKTKDDLVAKLAKLEVLGEEMQKKTEGFDEDARNSNTEDKKKRTRRPAVEIPRNFMCSVDKCQKLYGYFTALTKI